jgi:hypothetical protein
VTPPSLVNASYFFGSLQEDQNNIPLQGSYGSFKIDLKSITDFARFYVFRLKAWLPTLVDETTTYSDDLWIQHKQPCDLYPPEVVQLQNFIEVKKGFFKPTRLDLARNFTSSNPFCPILSYEIGKVTNPATNQEESDFSD